MAQQTAEVDADVLTALQLLHERVGKLEDFWGWASDQKDNAWDMMKRGAKAAKEKLKAGQISFVTVRKIITNLDEDPLIDSRDKTIEFSYKGKEFKVKVDDEAHKAVLETPSGTFSYSTIHALESGIKAIAKAD